MEAWLALMVLAFAVSVDGFGVGMTYGMRKLKISALPILLISVCSFISVLIAGLFSELIFRYIPTSFADYLGGIILIGIGLWATYQALQPKEDRTPIAVKKKEKSAGPMVNWEIKKLGIVIQILRKPTVADIDGSGTISIKEAMLLGLALSLDAFGAGVGAAMFGYSIIAFALLVSIMCPLFLILGKKGGFKLSDKKAFENLVYLPGLLLLCIGIFNMI